MVNNHCLMVHSIFKMNVTEETQKCTKYRRTAMKRITILWLIIILASNKLSDNMFFYTIIDTITITNDNMRFGGVGW